MWLPEPIYERLPLAYLVIGVLFIVGTLYIGLEAPGASVYLGMGLFSIVSAVVVALRRRTERARKIRHDDAALDVDFY